VSRLHAEIATIRAQLDGLAAEAGARSVTPRQLAIASGLLNDSLPALETQLAAAARPAVLAPFAGRDAAAVWDALARTVAARSSACLWSRSSTRRRRDDRLAGSRDSLTSTPIASTRDGKRAMSNRGRIATGAQN